MVLRNRGQLGAIDRALRRERLRDRVSRRGAGIQTVAASPRSAAASLSARRRRRGLVRQAFEHRPAIAGGTGDRSASANAPNEKRKAPLK